MRTYVWFIVGLAICRESLLALGKQSNWDLELSQFVINPLLFLHVSLLMVVGLMISSIGFSKGLFFVFQKDWRSVQKGFCVMIYFITLISSWIWFVMTSFWGGIVLVVLTFLFLLSIIWDLGKDLY